MVLLSLWSRNDSLARAPVGSVNRRRDDRGVTTSDDTMYHEGMRRLQDARHTRRIADRLGQVTVSDAFTDKDRAFIEPAYSSGVDLTAGPMPPGFQSGGTSSLFHRRHASASSSTVSG